MKLLNKTILMLLSTYSFGNTFFVFMVAYLTDCCLSVAYMASRSVPTITKSVPASPSDKVGEWPLKSCTSY